MEELALNLTEQQVQENIINFPLIPTRNRLVITVNTAEEDDLDLVGAGLSETQYVMAKGNHVDEDMKPGTKVLLDLEKISVQTGPDTYEIKLDPVKVGDRVYAFMYDSAIKAIDNR